MAVLPRSWSASARSFAWLTRPGHRASCCCRIRGGNGTQHQRRNRGTVPRRRTKASYNGPPRGCLTPTGLVHRCSRGQQRFYTFFFLGFFVSFLRSMLFAIGQILPSPRLWPVLGRRVESEFQKGTVRSPSRAGWNPLPCPGAGISWPSQAHQSLSEPARHVRERRQMTSDMQKTENAGTQPVS